MLEATEVESGSPRGPRFPSSKFTVPRAPSRLVHRPRLFEQLDEGQHRRLTLVVGSPGAGKTVLLADWLAARDERPSAWLACDAADADPVRFFAGITEACRRGYGRPGLGEDARQLLRLDREITADVVAALADDLERQGRSQVLVIDDAHLAGADGMAALEMLLAYRPPGLQLVLATRVDPPLRLHRMRANEEITELRDDELSFSSAESALFLSGFDVRLSDRDLAVVHQSSEGWAAALQMAAISIHDAADPTEAARRVELRGRTVAGYFLDEVLYHQPPEVVDFMLATSVLDELSPGACAALCGDGAATLLEKVYRANLFVVLVDDDPRTFRYHHLIAEVLRSELHARDPARERLLRKLAAAYLADAGQVSPAARHLLAAGESAAAFSLLRERVIIDFGASPALGSAFDADDVRPELFAGSPDVLVLLATDLLLHGAFERGSQALSLAGQATIDAERQPDLALQLGLVSSFYLYCTGQLDEALECTRSLTRPAVVNDELRNWVEAIDAVGMLCHAYKGDLAGTVRFGDALAAYDQSEPVLEILLPGAKSEAALYEGALGDAEALARSAAAAVHRAGFDRHYFAFHPLRALALVAIEKRELTTAEQLTERALATLVSGRPIFDCLAQLDRARIWAARGDLDGALASIPRARAALRTGEGASFAEADELEARLRLGLGDRAGAERVAGRLPAARRLVVSAMIAVAARRPDDAVTALDNLRGIGVNTRVDVEARLLRASIALLQGSPRAEALVRDALSTAERHGFVQTVLDTAPRLVEHVVSNSSAYPRTAYIATLITGALDARRTSSGDQFARLRDPLTEAELRVLERLPLRLSYSEMATDLHLSLNTIKTHLQHTYTKLGVTSRSDAVKRASALGLV